MDKATRLTVNPDPLKAVSARPGEAAPGRLHVLAVKLTEADGGANISNISVHREGCSRTPRGEGWVVKTSSREEITWMLNKADETDEIRIKVSISCRTCGGWSALP